MASMGRHKYVRGKEKEVAVKRCPQNPRNSRVVGYSEAIVEMQASASDLTHYCDWRFILSEVEGRPRRLFCASPPHAPSPPTVVALVTPAPKSYLYLDSYRGPNHHLPKDLQNLPAAPDLTSMV
jgi:hypothetical protein